MSCRECDGLVNAKVPSIWADQHAVRCCVYVCCEIPTRRFYVWQLSMNENTHNGFTIVYIDLSPHRFHIDVFSSEELLFKEAVFGCLTFWQHAVRFSQGRICLGGLSQLPRYDKSCRSNVISPRHGILTPGLPGLD